MSKVLRIAALCCVLLLVGCASDGVRGSGATLSTKTTTYDTNYRPLCEKRVEVRLTPTETKGGTTEDLTLPEMSISTDGGTIGPATWHGMPNIDRWMALRVIGGLLIAAGLVVGYLAGWKLGAIVSASGAALIGAVVLFDSYPWVVLLPVALGLVVAGWVLWRLWDSKRADATLKAVVGGIGNLKNAEREAVKKAIKEKAGDAINTVRSGVQATKKRIKI